LKLRCKSYDYISSISTFFIVKCIYGRKRHGKCGGNINDRGEQVD
jgi:hypothetical protein